MVTVGIDLGGTNIYTVVLDGETVVGHARLRTPATGERTEVLDVMDAAVRDALDDAGRSMDDVEGVGVGSPGVVMAGTVGGASNVPGFLERFSLADLFKQKVGRDVRVSNDVTAAAVAEHRLGAGRGTDDVLGIHVGTGVGGGIILGGKPFEGGAGGAGEFGHIVVRRGGAVCTCGRRGCVEAYAGRRAMELAAERAVAGGASTILFDVMREMGKSHATSAVFHEAYDRGDPLVADLLDGAIEALGAGIASTVNLLDVDAVVLGGGLADRFGEWFRMRVDAAMRPHLFLQPPRVRVISAELAEEGGAIGAALLAAGD